MTLWKRLEDGDEGEDAQGSGCCEQEKGDTGGGLLQLIEMLFDHSTQAENVVQCIYAGMSDLRAVTRAKWVTMLQIHELGTRLAKMDHCDDENMIDRALNRTASEPPLSDL